MAYSEYTNGYTIGYEKGRADQLVIQDLKVKDRESRLDTVRAGWSATMNDLGAARATIERLTAELEGARADLQALATATRRTNPPITIPVTKLGKKRQERQERQLVHGFAVGDIVRHTSTGNLYQIDLVSTGGGLIGFVGRSGWWNAPNYEKV